MEKKIEKSTTSGVTVVMAFRNAERFIAESIESILNQSYQNFNLILIDDASTDNTKKIIQPYLSDTRIKSIFNASQKGKSANLNMGINLSKDEYIAILDGDDVAMPDRLQKQVDYLNKHPEIDAVGSFFLIVDEFGTTIDVRTKPTDPIFIRKSILFYNPIIQPSVMLRKSAVIDVGLYDASIVFAQDIDMWLRLVLSGHKITNIPEYLTKYRIHDQNTGRENRKVALYGLRLKLKNIRRFSLKLKLIEWIMIYGQFIIEYSCTKSQRMTIESLVKRILTGRK